MLCLGVAGAQDCDNQHRGCSVHVSSLRMKASELASRAGADGHLPDLRCVGVQQPMFRTLSAPGGDSRRVAWPHSRV